MIIIAVSDLHLGKGKYLQNGQINLMEDFQEDDRFVEFINYLENLKDDVHLVLNGDILNCMQVDVEGIYNTLMTEEHIVKSLKKIVNGHQDFFKCLSEFLKKPGKKITYVIGNHDLGMVFPLAQQYINDQIGEVEFCFETKIGGVYFEHGQRFEAINSVPKNKRVIKGPNGRSILNLPWGSLFCVAFLPRLKKERPHIDKVRPLRNYLTWCFLHDTKFFFKIFFQALEYIMTTGIFSPMGRYFPLRKTMSLIRQVMSSPKYENKAKRILRKNPGIHTVVLSHTHGDEWRRFADNRFYFNTGTWVPTPSTNNGLHQDDGNLSYVLIEVDSAGSLVRASLNTWLGHWTPYREKICINSTVL